MPLSKKGEPLSCSAAQEKSPFWMEMPTCSRLARSGTSISSASRKR